VSAGAPAARQAPSLWTFPRWRDAAPVAEGERPWVRLITFALLAGYGVQRWAALLHPAPGWRLAGLLLVAVVFAGGVPVVVRQSKLIGATAAFLLVLVVFPVAGLRWHWFTHVRVAVSADRIGTGLQTLPNTLVPYIGGSHAVRLVIMLGAAVLLLDAAAVLALSGRTGSGLGDGRRAVAALPLIALAIVPSTLIRPQLPYLQGLVLFALLAAFMWGERVRRDAAASAVVIVTLAGVGAAVAAPRIDQGRPWVNYRAWAGAAANAHVDTFNWNQTYGPLRWPRSGHAVVSVAAKRPEYWKAEDLDTFNGYGWVQGSPTIQSALPQPSAEALARWTEPLQVTILGMQTQDVVAAGYASEPSGIPGALGEGDDPGTWVAGRTLGPGTSYAVSAYSPHPTADELTAAGRRYPASALTNYLTLGIPLSSEQLGPVSPGRLGGVTLITFPRFGAEGRPVTDYRGISNNIAELSPRLIEASPYGDAYKLARRLRARARTPYAFVAAVQAYLAHGFAYNQNTARERYPLESFLFSTKQGYCQQFSGSMAMLLRMGGIPARVAAGFTSGTYEASSHRWVATDIDAHAWVEVWFPHYGWVRFDPTPTNAPARGGAVAPPILKPTGDSAKNAAAAIRREIGDSTATGAVAHRKGGGGVSSWLIVLLLAVAAGAVAWPLGRMLR
jgi:protein-glutamine gamma-glutamyltransferase